MNKKDVIIALDFATGKETLAFLDLFQNQKPFVKVGMELFYGEGPDIVREIKRRGLSLFLDLKLHDIPNTVATAIAAAAQLGVWMVNVHASGGISMMRAARDAAHESSARAGKPAPLVIAVTVLTSMNQAALKETGIVIDLMDQVLRLAELTKEAGLDGVVASPRETAGIRHRCGESLLIVTPGIRAADAAKDDQARTMTPAEAVAAGASYLVVGRPIIAAPDPVQAAASLVNSLARPKA
jgi:orotidine-5'-phosphate decarboxylase